LKVILPQGDYAIFIVTPDDGYFVEEIRKRLSHNTENRVIKT